MTEDSAPPLPPVFSPVVAPTPGVVDQQGEQQQGYNNYGYCMLTDDATAGAGVEISPAATTNNPSANTADGVSNFLMGTMQQQQQSHPSAYAPHDSTNPVDGMVATDGMAETALLEAAGYPFDQEPTTVGGDPNNTGIRKRRICRFPGCERVIKSQGHCQRHGAAVKRCKVDGCDKQAQGAFQGMCKRHWKEINGESETTAAAAVPQAPPPPTGESVYDSILPQSITYKPMGVGLRQKLGDQPATFEPGAPVMPLVIFLRNNAEKEFGWHRREERLSRGCLPVTSPAARLENWERQLVLVEILLLSGGTVFANFRDLAHAWGREKNFHTTLALSVFERRGDLERKRRSDAGKPRGKRKKATPTTFQQPPLQQNATDVVDTGNHHHNMNLSLE